MPKFKGKNVEYALVTFHVTHCDPIHENDDGELIGSSESKRLFKLYPYLKNTEGNFRRIGKFVFPDSLNPCHYGMSFAFENASPNANTRINSEEQSAYIKSQLPMKLWQFDEGIKGHCHIDHLFTSISKAGIDLHFKNSYPKISRQPKLVQWHEIYDAVKPDDPYWNRLVRKRFDFLSFESRCMEDSDED